MTTQSIQPDSVHKPRRSTSHAAKADELIIHIDRTEWDGFAGITCFGHLEPRTGAARPADSRSPEQLLGAICEPMN
ncbi:MAG: hypothetical protein EA376_11465 [Phycisphaeraceae bacterium]|nr:MAG: hypothetical protein EA376_11465 [Phycisphaeraceae bacterium]